MREHGEIKKTCLRKLENESREITFLAAQQDCSGGVTSGLQEGFKIFRFQAYHVKENQQKNQVSCTCKLTRRSPGLE